MLYKCSLIPCALFSNSTGDNALMDLFIILIVSHTRRYGGLQLSIRNLQWLDPIPSHDVMLRLPALCLCMNLIE